MTPVAVPTELEFDEVAAAVSRLRVDVALLDRRITTLEGFSTPPPPPPPGLDLILDPYPGGPWHERVDQSNLITSGPQVNNIRTKRSYTNVSFGFNNPIWVGQPTDPARTLTATWGTDLSMTIPHYPPKARSATGGDGYMHIVSGTHVWDVYQAQPRGQTGVTRALFINEFDLAGSAFQPVAGNTIVDGQGGRGSRAGSCSAYAGVIQQGHIDRGFFSTALVVSMDPSQLKRGYISPARSQDGNPVDYAGENPIGTRIALPASFNTAGMTVVGKMIAEALKWYGAYVMDTGAGGVIFYADDEPTAELLDAERAGDFARMHAAMVVAP